MDKRPIGYKPGEKYILDKKIPKSNKYKHVKKTLNTGKTKEDVNVISDKMVAKRRSEVFSRIGGRGIVELLKIDSNTESIYNMGGDNEAAFPNEMNDNRSQFTSITNQTGVSIKTSKTMKTQYFEINPNTDFIILDLREPEDYDAYHIKEAISFPEPFLYRDKFVPIILKFKNKQDHLIIIYHTEEKKGLNPAKIFYEKGFDNVYLLTGGLEKFHSHFPDHVEGNDIPVPKPIEKKTQERKKTITKGRQPGVAKGKPRPKKGTSKVGSKQSRALKGKQKQKFEDIPDNVSDYSKITGTRRKFIGKGPEKGLTEKPTNIRMQGNQAVVTGRNLGGNQNAQREVTDKPNNIRAPIHRQ